MVNKKEEKAKLREQFLKKLDNTSFRINRTLGQKAADLITKWAGSWVFIMGFLIFIAIWMVINIHIMTQYLLGKPWDPYPFILLNLILSCLAALQAPIILMSQNRQAQRDRLKTEYDYRIDKKAEKEIREIRNILRKHFKKKNK